jgi:hypothetical protein
MSTLTVTNIQATGETASRAVSGVAAAWVNFNGDGTVSIQQSQNISSLSDNGTGQYTVTFTNNFNSARHASVASCGDDTSSYDSVVSLDPFPSASEQFVLCWDLIDHVLEDQVVVSIISHGDLA